MTILRYTVAQDAGQALHPAYVEGQFQGGAVQGIGWALNEEYIYGADGKLQNAGFLDYRMPVASDVPMIDAILVEVANPKHPYGVRGVGETPIVPPLGAIANAMENATGIRFTELPMSPPKVLKALKEQGVDRRGSSRMARVVLIGNLAQLTGASPSSSSRRRPSSSSSSSSPSYTRRSGLTSTKAWRWPSTARSTRTPSSSRSRPTARCFCFRRSPAGADGDSGRSGDLRLYPTPAIRPVSSDDRIDPASSSWS